MPMVYQQTINEHSKIGIWHITEPELFFAEFINLVQPIAHSHKRLQHLAGRYLLSLLEPAFPMQQIQIAANRKPFLENEDYHFSISHCGNYAAAIISKHTQVGIDIEIPQPKIEKLQYKFLSNEERSLLQNIAEPEIWLLTTGWSIKEALFKWNNSSAIDFIKHLQIISMVKNEMGFIAKANVNQQHLLTVEIKWLHGLVLSWVIKNKA